MAFPLIFGGVEAADASALAALVRAGCGRRDGPRPSEEVAALVRAGALAPKLAAALATALLAHPEPGTVCEGARLATALRAPVLGPILLRALAEHDTALLLQVDPVAPGLSVEDTLTTAALEVADLADREVRRTLLTHLRQAGLRELEVRLLAGHGDADDLAESLPGLREEGLPAELLARLEGR